jgi:hypothetical protein
MALSILLFPGPCGEVAHGAGGWAHTTQSTVFLFRGKIRKAITLR